ncbi:MAG: hypothetical protein HY917_04625, partial [Candidatus Diapherotrites archaeon]|nr:hypothetical protein [Candidatus Diapherotrites archaeon]
NGNVIGETGAPNPNSPPNLEESPPATTSPPEPQTQVTPSWWESLMELLRNAWQFIKSLISPVAG